MPWSSPPSPLPYGSGESVRVWRPPAYVPQEGRPGQLFRASWDVTLRQSGSWSIPSPGSHFPLFLCSNLNMVGTIWRYLNMLCSLTSPCLAHTTWNVPSFLTSPLNFSILSVLELSHKPFSSRFSSNSPCSTFLPNHLQFLHSLAEGSIPLMCSHNSLLTSLSKPITMLYYRYYFTCFYTAIRYSSQGYDF